MSYRCNNCGTMYGIEPEKCPNCGRMDFKQNACACNANTKIIKERRRKNGIKKVGF